MKSNQIYPELNRLGFSGVSIEEQMVATGPNVWLRVVVFQPLKPKDNPAVVFVAGWMSIIDGWIEVLKEMTRDFVVYYVETREKKSSRIKGHVRYGVRDIGMDIVKIVDHFGLKDNQYLIAGSSLGATAVLDCHGFFNALPLTLVMINPNAEFRIPKIWKWIIGLFYPPLFVLFRPVVKWYLRTFRLDIHSDPAQYKKYCGTLDNADPWKSKRTAMAIWNYQIWDKLQSVQFPTLIVGASRDKLHEPENIQRMVSQLPGATYLDMETNARNHSQELVEEIRKYLDNLPGYGEERLARISHRKLLRNGG